MKEQFTPGPWVAQNWVSSDNGDFPIEINAAGWPKGKRVAKLDFTIFDSFGHDNIYQPGEAKANAALIAAAPDMYEALKILVEAKTFKENITDIVGWERDKEIMKYQEMKSVAWDKARTAILKANPQ